MAKTYKFGSGTWATKKGSTLAYNDEGGNFKPLPFTYTGFGKGTRVNKQGLIEVVENDRPRIDYLDSEDGVFLLEKASTNKITYSEDFSQSVWTKSNSSITSNSLISPDGTLNADLLTQTSDGGIIRFNTTYSGFETVSVFAKKGSANFIGLFSAGNEVYFDLNNGISASYSGATIVNYGIQSYGNGWYRCYLTTNYTGSSSVRVYPSETDGGSASSTESIYIYGSQLEVGNLSSYIPTQGNPQTRVQETASGSGNSEVFNSEQGVLFADIEFLTLEAGQDYFGINNGTNSQRVLMERNGSSFNTYINGLSLSATNISKKNKISVSYKLNDFKMYLNGFKVSSATSGATPTGLDRFEFKIGGLNLYTYAKTKEIAYYDTALTDLELETLTSYRTWEAMVKELNLNIIHNE